MARKLVDAGAVSRVLDQFEPARAVPDGQLLQQVRQSRSLGFVELQTRPFPAHDHVLSIAAGGPSLEDTWRDLRGTVVAINGSLGFLLERGVVPWACGVLDPRPQMARIVARDHRVLYFLASICNHALFEHLGGCPIVLWHPAGVPGMEKLAPCWIGGGATMGTRWIALGYYLGFRTFDLHGFDSSFRGEKTHAYDDYRDGVEGQEFLGYRTTTNFIEQIQDYVQMDAMFARLPEKDQPTLNLKGDGLLQTYWRQWKGAT